MKITEALKRAPVTPKQIKTFLIMMENPIPASDAIGDIHTLLDDDGLFDQIEHIALTDPDKDVRGIIASWIKMNHPCMVGYMSDADLTGGHWFRSPISSHPNDIQK